MRPTPTRAKAQSSIQSAELVPSGARPVPCNAEAQRTGLVIDRYAWGKIVACSLAPMFSSREFAKQFLTPLPQHAKDIFDPVRLKKILQRLCRDGSIEMRQRGRGGIPASYYVVRDMRRTT